MAPSASCNQEATFSARTPLPIQSGTSRQPLFDDAGTFGIGGCTGGAAGNDQHIGLATTVRIAGDLERVRARRRQRVFHQNVGADGDGDAQLATQAQGLVRATGDPALIGQQRTRVNVDPHEGRAAGRGNGQRRMRIVAQHIDAKRKGGCACQPNCYCAQRGHGLRWHLIWIERRITEVLHQQCIEPGLGQGTGVAQRALHYAGHRAAPAR